MCSDLDQGQGCREDVKNVRNLMDPFKETVNQHGHNKIICLSSLKYRTAVDEAQQTQKVSLNVTSLSMLLVISGAIFQQSRSIT